MTIDITQHAMIVNLHLGFWTGFKQDSGAGSQVATDAGADDAEAFSVSKRLVSKEAIKPLETARNAIRTHFTDRTLPWKDNGDRLLPRKMFQTFMDEHAPLEQAFADAAATFKDLYASERERARFRLGTRFNSNDYPHPDEIRRRFYCRVDIDGISDAKDFRVGLSQDAIQTIRGQIEEATMQRVFEAQRSVWARIEETVNHFAARMASQMEEPEDGKRRAPLYQSTIDNLIHLVNALPALNIVGDPNMKTIGRRLHGMLSTYNDVGKLKGKPEVCAAARSEVDAIIEEMAAYTQAFEEK